MDRASGDPPKTTLTEFFALCQVDDFAKTLLYVDVPQVLHMSSKSWNRRKQGTNVAGFPGVNEAHVLGRVLYHQSTSGRMLLPSVTFAPCSRSTVFCSLENCGR